MRQEGGKSNSNVEREKAKVIKECAEKIIKVEIERETYKKQWNKAQQEVLALIQI